MKPRSSSTFLNPGVRGEEQILENPLGQLISQELMSSKFQPMLFCSPERLLFQARGWRQAVAVRNKGLAQLTHVKPGLGRQPDSIGKALGGRSFKKLQKCF